MQKLFLFLLFVHQFVKKIDIRRAIVKVPIRILKMNDEA